MKTAKGTRRQDMKISHFFDCLPPEASSGRFTDTSMLPSCSMVQCHQHGFARSSRIICGQNSGELTHKNSITLHGECMVCENFNSGPERESLCRIFLFRF